MDEFEALLRAGMRTAVKSSLQAQKQRIAQAIFDEEQKCLGALGKKPTDPHLNGLLTGLQRARTIAASWGEQLEDGELKP